MVGVVGIVAVAVAVVEGIVGVVVVGIVVVGVGYSRMPPLGCLWERDGRNAMHVGRPDWLG